MKICDFVKPELDKFLEECNFTEEERQVFILLSKGCTVENTAEKCNMGISTIKRIKNRIWTKIERLRSL